MVPDQLHDEIAITECALEFAAVDSLCHFWPLSAVNREMSSIRTPQGRSETKPGLGRPPCGLEPEPATVRRG